MKVSSDERVRTTCPEEDAVRPNLANQNPSQLFKQLSQNWTSQVRAVTPSALARLHALSEGLASVRV